MELSVQLIVLPNVQHIRIPRWFGFDLSKVVSLQLHMFGNGSSLVYAAYGTLLEQRTHT